jgi:hypothetical protein
VRVATSRQAAREALVERLAVELSDLIQVFYNYPPGDTEGQSPVVAVSSGGSRGVPHTFSGDRATFFFDVDVLVATRDGAEDAEDALDAIDTRLRAFVERNRQAAAWDELAFAERSRATFVTIGGLEYRLETYPLSMEVY